MSGELIDPHTAIAVATARAVRRDKSVPMVALAARSREIPRSVESATGMRPPLPPALADLMTRRERKEVLPNNVAEVKRFVRDHVRAPGHNSRAAVQAGGAS